MPTIIVLVLANDGGGYDKMVQSVRDTWGSQVLDNIKIYYCYGHRENIWRQSETYAIEDCIYSDVPESRLNIYEKTMRSFKWLLENETFDYVYRCNCGSYVDLNNLNAFIEDKPLEHFYSGFVGTVSRHVGLPPGIERLPTYFWERSPISYASGSGFFLSKDLVTLLYVSKSEIPLRDPEEIKYAWTMSRTAFEESGFGKAAGLVVPDLIHVDDVIIGNFLMQKCNIPVVEAKRKSVKSLEDISNIDINEHYHLYFCHTINPALMYAAHSFYKDNRTEVL